MAPVGYAYVRLNAHADVSQGLSHTAERLQNCVDGASEARSLQAEKHQKIDEAKQKVAEILYDLEQLNKAILREKYERTLKKSEPKPFVAYGERKALPARRKAPEEDTLARSERALQNLQKNLEILKKQLQ